MSNRKPPRKRVLTDPAQMPDAEREYYRTVWGFDPVKDCFLGGKDTYRYESCMSLRQDPPLYQKDVMICARVDWRDDDIQNRIVFRHNELEAVVDCTHLVIHAGPLDDALTYAEDILTHQGELDENAREMVARAGGTVALPPWEHFAALKSYVAAVAEAGVLSLLNFDRNEKIGDAEGLPFGFNPQMQVQVIEALLTIARPAIQPLIQDYVIHLFDHVPAHWVMDRWAYLEHLFELEKIFGADPAPIFRWLMKWARETPSDLLCGETAENLRKIIKKDWKALIREWDAKTIKRFFRQSNLADRLQDYLFQDAGRLAEVRAEAPNVPWGRLRQEWRGRRRVVQILARENHDVDRDYPDVELLPIEVWPRGSLCVVNFPPFLLQNPELNAPNMANARLRHFLKAQIALLEKLQTTHEEDGEREDIDVPQEVLLELIDGIRVQNPTIYVNEHWEPLREKVVQSIQVFKPQNIQKTHEDPKEDVKNEIYMNFFIPDELVMRSLEAQDDLRQMAEHPKLPAEVANILVKSWNLEIRFALAGNPRVSDEILQLLAKDIQPCVKAIVEARYRRNTPAIEPLPGEILTPGEILWLLASHEGRYIFVNSLHIDVSDEYVRWYPIHWQQYKRWFDSHHSMRSLRLPPPDPSFHTWISFAPFIREVVEGIPDVSHLALDGLRQLACGWLPCMYLGPEPKSLKLWWP